MEARGNTTFVADTETHILIHTHTQTHTHTNIHALTQMEGTGDSAIVADTVVRLEHIATHCNTLQQTATHCNLMQPLQLTATQ